MLENLINFPEAENIFRALQSTNKQARSVGGCVRDAIINYPIKDVDIATELTPDEVIEILNKHNIKTIPTGIKFGTITAVIKHHSFEITTLRKDVETNGRHAIVEYTSDWELDAKRRDFTINAMSCDIKGKLFDYFNGVNDLESGVIRFVGDAHDRITEDYLRILRFFRFYCYYSGPTINHEALEACCKYAHKINTLSGERIQAEMLKILSSNNSARTLKLMQENKVLKYLIPISENYLNNFKILLQFEEKLDLPIKTERRLAALLYNSSREKIESLIQRFKLSNKYKNYLYEVLFTKIAIEDYGLEKALKKNIRLMGKDNFLDIALLQYINAQIQEDILYHIITIINSWTIPIFPVSGKDLILIGKKEGKELGELLSKAETFWEESNYKPTKDEILKYIL